MKNKKIQNKAQFEKVVLELANAGLTVQQILEEVRGRGVICFPVAIELVLKERR